MSGNLLTERSFAEIVAANGGRVYRVGGCVRDMFLGVAAKDIDLCVVGMVKRNFKTLFPEAEEYGKAFPVFRLLIDGVRCEVAFARTERKVGSGYKGFKVSSNPKVTIEEDLYRRDLTVNAIALDCLTGQVFDPYNGIQDINSRILRATSLHFSEDPIRALRLAGQAARLGFNIDSETLTLATSVAAELSQEPVERVLAELAKVLREAREPSRFFRALAAMRLLETTFLAIAQLPEEDFNMAMTKLDLVAQVTQDPKLRFAALGLVLDEARLLRWNKIMTLPGNWLDAAVAVRKVVTLLNVPNPENLVCAVYSLNRGSLQVMEFDVITQGVGANFPALTSLKAKMNGITDSQAPDTLKGKELGEWLRRKHIAAISD